MTHRVAVWLCTDHGSSAYLRKRSGRAFSERLLKAWRTNGTATRRRIAALATHQRQIREAWFGRRLPGSYAWPELRREAERRFAAGDDPNAVIQELRAVHSAGAARGPSRRTMRRWFQDGRWHRHPRGKPRNPPHRPLAREVRIKPNLYQLMPWALTRHHPGSAIVYVWPATRRSGAAERRLR